MADHFLGSRIPVLLKMRLSLISAIKMRPGLLLQGSG
jgi:hypothetical protein